MRERYRTETKSAKQPGDARTSAPGPFSCDGRCRDWRVTHLWVATSWAAPLTLHGGGGGAPRLQGQRRTAPPLQDLFGGARRPGGGRGAHGVSVRVPRLRGADPHGVPQAVARLARQPRDTAGTWLDDAGLGSFSAASHPDPIRLIRTKPNHCPPHTSTEWRLTGRYPHHSQCPTCLQPYFGPVAVAMARMNVALAKKEKGGMMVKAAGLATSQSLLASLLKAEGEYDEVRLGSRVMDNRQAITGNSPMRKNEGEAPGGTRRTAEDSRRTHTPLRLARNREGRVSGLTASFGWAMRPGHRAVPTHARDPREDPRGGERRRGGGFKQSGRGVLRARQIRGGVAG
jgi:hypothetical protein